ncbi:MAG: hypothetical protein PHY40_01820 [Patescibacteria group bacterium]|nr:hypothetical protein [Patescibacteria group bacterium]
MGKPKKEVKKRTRSFDPEEAKKEGCFVFLTEVGFDTNYFNLVAYKNLIEFLDRFSKQYQGMLGILLDGVFTSLHRPEYLNDVLTYWLKTEVECKRESKKIPNSEQYRMMFGKQLEILSLRLQELKIKLPNAKIFLNIFTDDLQFSLSQLLNEQLLFKQEELGSIINELKATKEKTKGKCRTIEASMPKAKKAQIAKLQTRLERKQTEIKKINDEIVKLGSDAIYFREKKVRPMSQYVTSELVRKIHGMFKIECDKYGVELITEDSLIQCGNIVIDYSHSRYPTWTPQKNVHKRLQAMVHGTMGEYFKVTSAFFGAESKNNRVDAIVESGHHGVGWKSLQKISRNGEEINFFNNDKCDPDTKTEYIVLLSALPFEDQEKIARYLSGKEPVRMSGGKPVGTRKNAAIDRLKNGGASGITFLAKDKNGLVSTRWIQYESFRDGYVSSVFTQDDDIQKPIPAILVTSDPHLGSKQDNITALNGVIKLFERGLNAETDIHIVGQKFKIFGDIQAGDIPESGPAKWGHCYESNRPRLNIEKHVMGILSKLDINSEDEVGDKKKKAVEVVKELSDLAMQGSNVSMSVLLGWAADYSMEFIRRSLVNSCLQHVHVSVPGNHADDVLHRNGGREQDILAGMLNALGIPYTISGSGNLFTKTSRVVLGGFSIARVVFVADYGKDTDGSAIFGPIKLFVQHDPKGSGSSGIVGAGKNSGADVAIGGHTHENYICIYKTGHNTFSVAFRASCIQGVDPTQMYYASALPRTAAAHIISMPMGGDFSEVSLPIEYLQDIGNEIIAKDVVEMLKKLMK